MAGARPVRVARGPGPVPPAREASPTVGRVSRPRHGDLRVNRAASTRAWRLAIIYVVGIAAVYAALVSLSRASAQGISPGAVVDLGFAGGLAAVMAMAGALIALGSAPRAVLLGEDETVVLGRFGGRHRFPGRGRLHAIVHQRFRAGWLTPGAVASVELLRGSSRRTFMLDEGLLDGALASAGPTDGSP